MTCKKRNAMALVELIIALTILACVATIAIVAVDDLGEMTRYDETERRGDIARRAVVGTDGETSRFANDMGRFPIILLDAADDSQSKMRLAELYELCDSDSLIYSAENAERIRKIQCSIVPYYSKIEGDSDSAEFSGVADPAITGKFPDEVEMSAGWDGPYIINSGDGFSDNWGFPWDIRHKSESLNEEKWAKKMNEDEGEPLADTSDELGLGTEILGVRSAYAEENKSDLSFKFPESKMFATEVSVELVNASGVPLSSSDYQQVRVFLYMPYCEPKQIASGTGSNAKHYPHPQIAELCAWVNTAGTSAGEKSGFRFRADTDFDGAISETSAKELIRAEADIPKLIRTRVAFPNPPNASSVSFYKVPVGTRKIWAYAKKNGDSEKSGIYAPLRAVRITPETSHIKLYLNEIF